MAVVVVDVRLALVVIVDLNQPVFAGSRGKTKLVLGREESDHREARGESEQKANGFEPRKMPTTSTDNVRARRARERPQG